MYVGASAGKWKPKKLIDLHAYTLYTKLKKTIAIIEEKLKYMERLKEYKSNFNTVCL